MSNNFPTIKPSLNLQFANTGALPPDVTFTRASSSGGYYDGVTVSKAEENLLLQSQTFDNASWTKTSSTITANTTVAPDGTTTADTFTASAGGTTAQTSQVILLPTGTHTISVYAKAGTNDIFDFGYTSQGVISHRATVDLTGETIINQAGTTSNLTLTDVGSGWYRCSFDFTLSANAAANSIAAVRGNAVSLDTETLILWGAQIETRAFVTAYTPTTTQPITNYIPKMLFAPANVPVFDHNPVTGEALGLSVWEARTNLLLRSQEFDNASWTKTRSSVAANQIIAPDGTLTADKLVEDGTAAATHALSQTFAGFVSGTVYTVSIFFKAGERTQARVQFSSAAFTTAIGSIFNISTGAVVSSDAGITATITAGGNGWYRCTITATATATASAGINIFPAVAGSSSYDGDNYSGIYLWGAQLE